MIKIIDKNNVKLKDRKGLNIKKINITNNDNNNLHRAVQFVFLGTYAVKRKVHIGFDSEDLVSYTDFKYFIYLILDGLPGEPSTKCINFGYLEGEVMRLRKKYSLHPLHYR